MRAILSFKLDGLLMKKKRERCPFYQSLLSGSVEPGHSVGSATKSGQFAESADSGCHFNLPALRVRHDSEQESTWPFLRFYISTDKCKLGYEEQSDWYFFSHKDRKYPTGTRTNRATAAGFWKATGRDKAVFSKYKLIGMRKTLVFYKGRAPNGRKTDWIMHEYRLESHENPQLLVISHLLCLAFLLSNTPIVHNFFSCMSNNDWN